MAFAQHWIGKGLLWVAISLRVWHAVHRILHRLHDLGVHNGALAKALCYGSAVLIAVVAVASLLTLGF